MKKIRRITRRNGMKKISREKNKRNIFAIIISIFSLVISGTSVYYTINKNYFETVTYNKNFDKMIELSVENIYLATYDIPVEIDNLDDFIKEKDIFEGFEQNKKSSFSIFSDSDIPSIRSNIGSKSILKFINESKKILNTIDTSKLDEQRMMSYISYVSFIEMQSNQAQELINLIDENKTNNIEVKLGDFKIETLLGLYICLDELKEHGSINSKLYVLKEQIMIYRTDREIASKIGGL